METDEPWPVRIIIIETQSEVIVSRILHELGTAERGRPFYIQKVERMGDVNYVSGQAAAVGSQAVSGDASLSQISSPGSEEADLLQLAAQLETVRVAMQRLSGGTRTPEQDNEIGHVAGAQIAAQKGDHKSVMTHLRQAGAWTLAVARETGAEIVALTLAHIIGRQ
jgi:hypothetical protein